GILPPPKTCTARRWRFGPITPSPTAIWGFFTTSISGAKPRPWRITRPIGSCSRKRTASWKAGLPIWSAAWAPRRLEVNTMGIQRGLISPQRSLVILGLLASAALMGYSGPLHAQEAAEQETAETEIQDTVATEAPATEPQSTGQTRGNRVVSLQTTVTGNQEQPRVLYL